MYLFLMILILMLLIASLIIKISMAISMKMKLNFEKMSPFECGFNPIFFKRMPFSIRFFMITIIFLIFDIEIALLMPMIMTMKLSNMNLWFLTSIMFNLILIIGLFHEWKNGALNWM